MFALGGLGAGGRARAHRWFALESSRLVGARCVCGSFTGGAERRWRWGRGGVLVVVCFVFAVCFPNVIRSVTHVN